MTKRVANWDPIEGHSHLEVDLRASPEVRRVLLGELRPADYVRGRGSTLQRAERAALTAERSRTASLPGAESSSHRWPRRIRWAAVAFAGAAALLGGVAAVVLFSSPGEHPVRLAALLFSAEALLGISIWTRRRRALRIEQRVAHLRGDLRSAVHLSLEHADDAARTSAVLPRRALHPGWLRLTTPRAALMRLRSDRWLLDHAARRNLLAFQILVTRYRLRLLALAKLFVGTGEAEDVVDETFTVAYEMLVTERPKRSAREWLYRLAGQRILARIITLDVQRTPTRLPSEEVEAPSVLQQDDETSARFALAALRLREIDRYSFDEIAGALGVSNSAARALVGRGLKELSSAIAASEPGSRRRKTPRGSGGGSRWPTSVPVSSDSV